MKKWITLTVGTCLIALALAALPAAVDGTIAPAVDEVLFPTVLDTLEAPACGLDAASALLLPGVAYECPFGVPYCRRAKQCKDYCAGGEPACEFGCCACAS